MPSKAYLKIQSFISPTNKQLICFKILKFTLKCAQYRMRLYTHKTGLD